MKSIKEQLQANGYVESKQFKNVWTRSQKISTTISKFRNKGRIFSVTLKDGSKTTTNQNPSKLFLSTRKGIMKLTDISTIKQGDRVIHF